MADGFSHLIGSTYTVTVTSVNGCTEVTSIDVTASMSKYWTGNVSEDWTNNLDWCGLTLPNANDDVIKPSTANHMPRLTINECYYKKFDFNG